MAVRTDIQNLKTALSRVRRFLSLPDLELPDEETVVLEWITQLGTTFEIVPITGDEARAALFREAHGRLPAMQKKGSRDAGIWEVVKRIHREGESDTYFVSHNSRDFADPKDASLLHGDLRAELGAKAERFFYLQSIDDVLGAFGNRVDRVITVRNLDKMNENGFISGVVAGWVQLNPGKKAFDAWSQLGLNNPPSSISVTVTEALPVAVESSATYDAEGSQVTLADTRFQISYDVHLIPAEEIQSFSIAGDLNVRLLLRELKGGGLTAEVLSASDATLTVFASIGRQL
jgi:hypothetical protein